MAFELGGNARKVRPVMNVTPLVDVVLVLLIIFMVITPLMARQLSVSVPIDATTPPPPPSPDDEPQVVLTVAPDGTARIGVHGYADADLPGTLRRVFAARVDQTLFFDASDETPYARAVEVLDVARGAGIATIAVLTEPIE